MQVEVDREAIQGQTPVLMVLSEIMVEEVWVQMMHFTNLPEDTGGLAEVLEEEEQAEEEAEMTPRTLKARVDELIASITY